MRQRHSFLRVIGAELLLPITMVNRVLTDMLPDILCKCKTRCTFIRMVHRSPYRHTGASRQPHRTRHLLTIC